MDKRRYREVRKVIVFYNWLGWINGAFIDAFEYFIATLEQTPVYFLVINCSPLQLKKLFDVLENRYILDDINWKDFVITMDRPPELIRYNFETALVVDYSTINKTKGILRADKIIVISDLHTDHKDFMYDKRLQNVIYYGEMPFVYKDYQYTMKMLFHRFPPLTKVEEGIYVNAPFKNNPEFISTLTLPDKPMVYKTHQHWYNMFEKFDTYLYHHTDWFDPHPRLFHECYFYGKKIIYQNPDGIKDGSWYRMKDLKENGLKNRYLNKDDEVVKEFL
jgi:hypothetical protein